MILYNKAKILDHQILKGLFLSKASNQSLRYDDYENLKPRNLPQTIFYSKAQTLDTKFFNQQTLKGIFLSKVCSQTFSYCAK